MRVPIHFFFAEGRGTGSCFSCTTAIAKWINPRRRILANAQKVSAAPTEWAYDLERLQKRDDTTAGRTTGSPPPHFAILYAKRRPIDISRFRAIAALRRRAADARQ